MHDISTPRDCHGGCWAEAIAALNIRSAELRMQAAKIGQDNAGGSPYGDWTHGFRHLHNEAQQLDALAYWLRDKMEGFLSPSGDADHNP